MTEHGIHEVGDADALERAALVAALARAYTLTELFPLDHPTLQGALAQVIAGTDDPRSLDMDVTRSGIHLGRIPVPDPHGHVREFGRDLSRAGVTQLEVPGRLSPEALERLISALRTATEAPGLGLDELLAEAGGSPVALAFHGGPLRTVAPTSPPPIEAGSEDVEPRQEEPSDIEPWMDQVHGPRAAIEPQEPEADAESTALSLEQNAELPASGDEEVHASDVIVEPIGAFLASEPLPADEDPFDVPMEDESSWTDPEGWSAEEASSATAPEAWAPEGSWGAEEHDDEAPALLERVEEDFLSDEVFDAPLAEASPVSEPPPHAVEPADAPVDDAPFAVDAESGEPAEPAVAAPVSESEDDFYDRDLDPFYDPPEADVWTDPEGMFEGMEDAAPAAPVLDDLELAELAETPLEVEAGHVGDETSEPDEVRSEGDGSDESEFDQSPASPEFDEQVAAFRAALGSHADVQPAPDDAPELEFSAAAEADPAPMQPAPMQSAPMQPASIQPAAMDPAPLPHAPPTVVPPQAVPAAPDYAALSPAAEADTSALPGEEHQVAVAELAPAPVTEPVTPDPAPEVESDLWEVAVPAAPTPEADGLETFVEPADAPAPDPVSIVDVAARFAAQDDEREGLRAEIAALAEQAREAGNAQEVARAAVSLILGAKPGDDEPRALAHMLCQPDVVDAMVEIMGEIRDASMREEWSYAFGRLGDVTAPALAQALSAVPPRAARRNYMDTLFQMEDVAIQVAMPMLEDSRWFIVRNGVDILGEAGDEKTVARLAHSLAHPDHRVRRATVMALSKLGGSDAGAHLIPVLDDPAPDVREAAAMGLGHLAVEKAARPLTRMLEAEREDESVMVLLRSLGQIGDPGAVPAIEKRAVGRFFIKPATAVRIAAYRALAAIGTPHARKLVDAALDDRDPQVAAVAQTLAAE